MFRASGTCSVIYLRACMPAEQVSAHVKCQISSTPKQAASMRVITNIPNTTLELNFITTTKRKQEEPVLHVKETANNERRESLYTTATAKADKTKNKREERQHESGRETDAVDGRGVLARTWSSPSPSLPLSPFLSLSLTPGCPGSHTQDCQTHIFSPSLLAAG
jgi:hypothetical protein